MNSGKPWIVMDLDDSACDFGPHVFRTFAAHYGAVECMTKCLDYHKMDQHLNCTLAQFFERLDSHDIYSTVPPLLHMRDALRIAHDRHWLVQWTTARSKAKNARTVTLNWLLEHDFPVDRLVITEPGQSKCDVLPDNTVITVEDNQSHCLSYAALGIPLNYLIDRPWNSLLPTPAAAVRGTSEYVADHLTTILCRTGD